MTDIPTITQEEAAEGAARKLLAAEYERLGVKVSARRLLADPGADMTQETAAMNVIAALSPNMDHAVGGVREGLRAGLKSIELAAGFHWSAVNTEAFENALDVLASHLPTPPVNQDAVREAGDIAAELDKLSSSHRPLLSAASRVLRTLATPPLDNTGLDAATVELREENKRLKLELDRFMRPDARNLSTTDPITPLPTFKAQHLRGMALSFRTWPHAELWGRPQEAELAARQAETAYLQIITLSTALKPFSDALDEWGDDPSQGDDWSIFDHALAMNAKIGDFRRAAVAIKSLARGQS